MGYNIPPDHHGPTPGDLKKQERNLQVPAERQDGVNFNQVIGVDLASKPDVSALAVRRGDRLESCVPITAQTWAFARERALIAFETPADLDKALAAFAAAFGIYKPQE